MDWWMWLAAGLVLLAVEMVTPGGFFVMFFGLGALAVGVLARLGLPGGAPAEWLAFTVLSVGSLLLFRGRLRAMAGRTPQGPAVDTFVGSVAIAAEAIAPGKVGRAEVRGTQWTARNDGAEPIATGQRCRVVRMDVLELGITPE
ncbi:MAG: NfeD family protein [Vicinamibacterales bacterium]